jgi:hypothetical protein
MPGYQNAQAVLLRQNQQRFLFQQEQVSAGRASTALQLERVNRSFYPWGVSFQVAFTDVNGNPANPGTFEVDIQTSDIDQDAQYCTLNSVTGPLNAGYAARQELVNFWAKYVRAYVKTLTNAVYVTLLVTR